MSLYGEGGYRRNDLGQLQAGFCIPSQMLVARMTAMQLLVDDFNKDTMVAAIWVAKAAPRRWFKPVATANAALSASFSAYRLSSKFGQVSFAVINPNATSILLNFTMTPTSLPIAGGTPLPIIHARLRSYSDKTRLKRCFFQRQSGSITPTVESIDTDAEVVSLSLKKRRNSTDEVYLEFVLACELTLDVHR